MRKLPTILSFLVYLFFASAGLADDKPNAQQQTGNPQSGTALGTVDPRRLAALKRRMQPMIDFVRMCTGKDAGDNYLEVLKKSMTEQLPHECLDYVASHEPERRIMAQIRLTKVIPLSQLESKLLAWPVRIRCFQGAPIAGGMPGPRCGTGRFANNEQTTAQAIESFERFYGELIREMRRRAEREIPANPPSYVPANHVNSWRQAQVKIQDEARTIVNQYDQLGILVDAVHVSGKAKQLQSLRDKNGLTVTVEMSSR